MKLMKVREWWATSRPMVKSELGNDKCETLTGNMFIFFCVIDKRKKNCMHFFSNRTGGLIIQVILMKMRLKIILHFLK